MALNAIAIDVMLPALPYMGEALGVENVNERQFVVSAYMLGFGVGQLAYGPLSDRFGRRGPLLVGLVIYVAAAVAAIFSPSFAVLLVLRIIQGMGAASSRVVATSMVRDKFSGTAMAEVMSLTFMVLLTVPILAPSIGQIILLAGPWEAIFMFMAGLAAMIGLWALLRLPETLPVQNRRELTFLRLAEGFRLIFTNRTALGYSLAGTCVFGALFGYVTSSQQIYVEVYHLGVYFPIAFASAVLLMALSAFLNSRIVKRFGMRRLAHFAIIMFIVFGGIWLVLGLLDMLPLWLFMPLLAVLMFMFGWTASNMNSLSMEPLGAVAGTASSVFGFTQTVGGALIGSFIGQHFDGTVVPAGAGFFATGVLALACVLVAGKRQAVRRRH